MYRVILKNIALLLIVIQFAGCTSTPAKNKAEKPDCNKTLAFVHSPENTVSADGFIILWDGENKEIFPKLMEKALENQKSYGCNQG